MTSSPKRQYTEAEYLAMDAASESKLEYIDGQIYDLGELNGSDAIPGMPRPRYTHVSEADYLALDKASEMKLEYIDGSVYAMAGASENHIDIVTTLTALLYRPVRQGGCKLYQNDMRVQVNGLGRYVYPDLSIVCGQPQFREDTKLATLLNPTLIIEVLSEATELYDRTTKFHSYQQIDVLQGYMLVAQDGPRIECFTRSADDSNAWILTQATELADSIRLPVIDLALQLADVYEQITFAD
jgi:Uma2 family endonuclease